MRGTVFMKKFLIIFLFFITSCSKPKPLVNIDTYSGDSSSFDFASLASNGEGIYYSQDNALRYYDINNKKSIKLSSTRYADDKEVESESNEHAYDHYFEGHREGSNLVLYDNHIYGLFSRFANDGSFSYSLKRFDSKGKNLTEIIKFDYFPETFEIDSGKIYVHTYNEKDLIKVYDKNYNFDYEIEVPTFSLGSKFYLINGELIIPENTNSLYLTNTVRSGYSIENGPTSNDPSVDDTKVTGNITVGNESFAYPDKVIGFVSGEYYYTANVKGIQAYDQYDLKGNLLNTVVVSDSLKVDEMSSNMFWESDFPIMSLVIDNKYIVANGREGYYICSIDNNDCNYLNE